MEKKILLIGREAPQAEVYQSILRDEVSSKVNVIYLNNAFENYIQYYNPDLIIATSGYHEPLIKDMKADKKLKHIPILLLSGFYTEEDFLNTAADDFMSKPIDIGIFIAKVKRLLR